MVYVDSRQSTYLVVQIMTSYDDITYLVFQFMTYDGKMETKDKMYLEMVNLHLKTELFTNLYLIDYLILVIKSKCGFLKCWINLVQSNFFGPQFHCIYDVITIH